VFAVGYTMDILVFSFMKKAVEIDDDVELPHFKLKNITQRDCSQNYTAGMKTPQPAHSRHKSFTELSNGGARVKGQGGICPRARRHFELSIPTRCSRRRQTLPSVPPPGELGETYASSLTLVHSLHYVKT